MIVVRVLDDDRVVREALFNDAPVLIGRDPSCDFLVASPSVSRQHARIESSDDAAGGESLVIRSLEGRNGLRDDTGRVERLDLKSRVRVRLGDVTIEIERIDPGATTIELKAAALGRDRRRGLGFIALCLIAALGAFSVQTALDPSFWNPWNKTRGAALGSAALGGVVGTTVLAFGLFVFYKALGRRVRPADTFAVLASVAWLFPLFSGLKYLLYYVLDPAVLEGFGSWLSGIPSTIAVVAVASARARTPRPWVLRSLVAIATLSFLAASGWIQAQTAAKTGAPWKDFAVQAPLFGFTGPAGDLDSVMRSVSATAGRARARAAEVEVAQRDQ